MLRYPLAIAILEIALNTNLVGYTTAIPNRFVSHSTISDVKASSVVKPLASGSVSRKNLLIASSGTSGTLGSGQSLAPNQSITSANGLYKLTCQSDGNLVLYDNSTNRVYWQSQTSGRGLSQCIMQTDGNLVLYNNSQAIWYSGTSGNSGAYLRVQNDRNVVIYDANNQFLWQTSTSAPPVNLTNATYTVNIPTDAATKLQSLSSLKINPQTIAFTPNGGWVILYNNGITAAYNNIPPDAVDKIKALQKQGSTIKTIAFTPNGGWVIIYGSNRYAYSNSYAYNGIPQDLIDKLGDLKQQYLNINVVAFAPNGGWVVITDNNYYNSSNIPQDVSDKLGNISQNYTINSVAFTPNGGWVILYHYGPGYYRGISQDAGNAIMTQYNANYKLINIAFTPDNGWALLFNKDSFYP